jgi:hypothetical protein
MVLGSLLDQGDHLQISLDDDNLISTPLKGTTFSSISVCINVSNSTNKEINKIKKLVILHKQAKFWANYNRKYAPWSFFAIYNGDFPKCEEV